MKKIKTISLLLVMALLFQIVSLTGVFAAQIPVAPVVTKTLNNGIYSITITNENVDPNVVTLVYSTDETTWQTGFNFATMPDGVYTFRFKFITGTINNPIDQSEVTVFEINNQNNEVASIKSALDTEASKTLSMDNIFTVENNLNSLQTRINAIVDSDQRGYLQTRIDTIKASVNSFKVANALNIVNYYIDQLPTNTTITQTQLDDVYSKIVALDSATYRTSAMGKFADKIKANTMYNARKLNIVDNDLNYSFNTMYLRGNVTVGIDKVFTAYTDNLYTFYVVLKSIESTSPTLNSVPYGEIERWIQENILQYAKGVIPYVDSAARVKLIGSDYKEIKTLNYPVTIFTAIDFSELQGDVASLQDSFEYLTFSYKVFTNNSTIYLVAYGDFSQNDSDWKNRDTAGFNDWLTYEVAEPLISKYNMDVEIKVLDKNYSTILSKTVPKDTTGYDSSYASLISYLNSYFGSHVNNGFTFKFTYEITGNQRTTNVKVIGTNFRERYDEWRGIDMIAFEDWIISMGKEVIADKGTNVNIKVYDRNRELIYNIEMLSSDYISSYQEVSNYLNDKYYKRNGYYYYFELKKGDPSNYLTITIDINGSSSVWTNFNKSELELWLKNEVMNYIMNAIPKNTTVYIKDERGSLLKTYYFYKANFGEVLTVENSLNQEYQQYNSLKFIYQIDNTSSYELSLKMKGSNFRYNDSVWTNVKDTSGFKEFVEKIVDELITKFEKNVRISVYDENDYFLKYFSYSKNYKELEAQTKANNLRSALNSYFSYINNATDATADDIRITYTVTPKNGNYNIEMRMSSVRKTDRIWDTRNKAKVEGFLNAVLYKAVNDLKAKVSLSLYDSSGSLIVSKSMNYGDTLLSNESNEKISDFNYVMFKPAIVSNTENGVTTISLNNGLTYLIKNNQFGSSMNNKYIAFNIPEGSKVKVFIDREDIVTLKGMGIGFVFADNNAVFSIASSSLDTTKDFTLEINKEDYSTLDGKRLASPLYDINTNLQISMKVYYPTRATSLASLELSKLSNSGSWTNASGQRISTSGFYRLNNVTSGKYAVTGKTTEMFSDISYSIFKNEISALKDYKIVAGVGENKFNPSSLLKRAEFVQMLVNGLNLKGTSMKYFDDVKSSDWYYNAVSVAKQYGLVEGVGGNKFNPNDNISRQEIMVILYRAAQNKNIIPNEPTKTYSSVPFADESSISSWAREAIDYMRTIGVLDNSGGRFDPLGYPTREEMSYYLYKLLKVYNMIS